MDGVHKSINGGGSWSDITGGGFTSIVSMALEGGNLYVGRLNDGLYKSANGGASWAEVNNGLAEKKSGRLLSIR